MLYSEFDIGMTPCNLRLDPDWSFLQNPDKFLDPLPRQNPPLHKEKENVTDTNLHFPCSLMSHNRIKHCRLLCVAQ
jgi:hypothetical protein